MTSIRDHALDAAIDLVGTEGLRALTHARVDERAGLPKGSTSNHFRTRAALLSGTVDWIAQREMPEVVESLSPHTAEELVDALCRLLDHTTGTNRTSTAARLILFMEASHNADLQESVSRGRSAMEAALIPALTGLGAHDPRIAADTIMACLEGIILHRIARHDQSDARPIVDAVVAAALR